MQISQRICLFGNLRNLKSKCRFAGKIEPLVSRLEWNPTTIVLRKKIIKQRINFLLSMTRDSVFRKNKLKTLNRYEILHRKFWDFTLFRYLAFSLPGWKLENKNYHLAAFLKDGESKTLEAIQSNFNWKNICQLNTNFLL